MSHTARSFATLLVTTGALAALTLLAACGSDDEPIACAPLESAATGFAVTITTGDDASDADIFFCVEKKSDANRVCSKMGKTGIDDWDRGSIETYDVLAPVGAGDLAGVSIENRGDAPDLSLDGNTWQLQGVRLVAQTAAGGVLLFDAQNLGRTLGAGASFDPGCAY